ncbi:hypothetical protein [Blastococcus saxobsidens]|uniref:hypothetical protein n=1 Tax=Blastococcus saxobsidens TaxID=138336 RepID=UPI00195430DA|nr:hypothetical protein [Blastococcus saxobsidens]
MTSTPATWKIVTFGTALTGLGIVGVGVATADDGPTTAQPAGISVAVDADRDGGSDASPESADSPAESATDSPDVQTPDVDSPDVQTPDVDSPDVQTPDVDSPDVQTPDVDSPDRDDD